MKKKPIWLIITLSFVTLTIGISYSHYILTTETLASISLAKWNISVNGTKVSEQKSEITITDYVLTEDTTTKRTSNLLVPGCAGYFDLKIDPKETEVAFRYVIDFHLNNLPGGFEFVNYDIVGESCGTAFPDTGKIIGSVNLPNHQSMNENNIITYRIYFNYIDDDKLNKIMPENNRNISISISLSQII